MRPASLCTLSLHPIIIPLCILTPRHSMLLQVVLTDLCTTSHLQHLSLHPAERVTASQLVGST